MKRMTLHVLLALLVIGCAKFVHADPAASQTLADAVAKTQADIEKATQELTAQRDEIAQLRRPLVRQLEERRKAVSELRGEGKRLQRLTQQGEQEQEALRRDVASLEEECRFLQTLFSEYRRSMETRAGVAERPLLQKLATVDALLSDEDDYGHLPEGAATLMDQASAINEQRIGGLVVSGQALDDAGNEQQGRFVVLGPVAYFVSDDGRVAGLAQTKFGDLLPGVYTDFASDLDAQIASLADGNPIVLPLDVTDGNALKVAQARPTLIEHLKKGGFVMVPLLLVGFLAAVLIVWKIFDLARVRVQAGDTLNTVLASLRSGDVAGAERRARDLKEPLASLVMEAIQHRAVPREHLEEILHEHVLSSLPHLERHLGTLAVFGGIAPLLGLLGTVTGMIHTFQLVTVFGSGDARLLSSGIAEALVTTEVGLVIAVPVLLAHAFLARRARTKLADLERTAGALVNALVTEA